MTAKWMKVGTLALATLGFSACESPCKVHEGKAKVVRTYVNRRDDKGEPLVTDVELSLEGCQGELRMVARGGAPFAGCVAKKSNASAVSVKVQSGRTRDGHLATRLVAIDECVRDPDPSDSRSFEAFRACTPVMTDEVAVGFRCEVAPTDEAKAACPWLAR